MNYIKTVRDITTGKDIAANAFEHYLANIVIEARMRSIASRDFVLINNGLFRIMPEFRDDWYEELIRFCKEFDLTFNYAYSGRIIEFYSIK